MLNHDSNYSINIKPIKNVLSRLTGVKYTGDGRYQASCPAHPDKEPSLTVTEGHDGKVLLHCHAGCQLEDILKAMEIEIKDLFPRQEHYNTEFQRKIKATYDYRDEDGKLIFQTLRYEPKEFRQRRPDGKDGWIWNLQGIRLIPYRLPELIQALNDGKMVFIVEGEKDCETLFDLGLTATCNHGGAGKWRESHTQYFDPTSKVTIINDNDEAGQKHGRAIAKQLQAKGCQVRIMDLPGLPDKGDVTTWVKTNPDKDLQDIVKEEWDKTPVVNQDLHKSEEQWPEIIPFLQHPVTPFPIEVLPPWLRTYVKALAVQSQVPLEFPALLSLAVVAIPAARMYQIQARPGWVEPLNLYVMTILESGNRKSGTEREMLAPIYDFEKKLIEEVKPAWEMAKHELDCKKAALDDLKKVYVRARNGKANAVKNEAACSSKTPAQIKDEIDGLAGEIANMPEKQLPTILADDITMEKMVVLLAENQGNLAIFSAEATLFGIAAGRYSGVANIDDLLKAHAGDPIKHDRIGRGRVDVPNPGLTLGLAVQPIVLQELSQNPTFRLKGLQARFLYSMPESPLGYRRINSPHISENIKTIYYNPIRRLLYNAWQGTDEKLLLELSPEANELLIEFEQWVEPQLRENGRLRPVVDWAAKLAGAILRIAGVLHIADYADIAGDTHGLSIPQTVSADTMDRAIQLADFLISHARKSFDVMDIADDDIPSCKKVLHWIDGQSAITEFTKRDLFCALQSTFKKVEYLDPVLRILTDHNFIKEQLNNKSGSGRRSNIYKINPLTAKYAEYAKDNKKGSTADYADIADKDASIKTKMEPIFWSDAGKVVEGGGA